MLKLESIALAIKKTAILDGVSLELKEGEASAGKYLDKDSLGEGEEAYEGTHRCWDWTA